MKTFTIGVLLGILIGAGGLWFLRERQGVASSSVEEIGFENAKRLVDAKLEALELQAGKVHKELAETGRVVRRRASALAESVGDAAADTRITALIKAKLVADRDLSALDISVSTTDAIVTLSGKVASPELVGKAMLAALETEGVREVIATLQITEG